MESNYDFGIKFTPLNLFFSLYFFSAAIILFFKFRSYTLKVWRYYRTTYRRLKRGIAVHAFSLACSKYTVSDDLHKFKAMGLPPETYIFLVTCFWPVWWLLVSSLVYGFFGSSPTLCVSLHFFLFGFRPILLSNSLSWRPHVAHWIS